MIDAQQQQRPGQELAGDLLGQKSSGDRVWALVYAGVIGGVALVVYLAIEAVSLHNALAQTYLQTLAGWLAPTLAIGFAWRSNPPGKQS